ncbi:MAG TPA: 2-hydroxyacid dehydrogenase [Jatrophihabitantaceae bacterium]
MSVICLPDADAVELVGALPDGVEVVTWGGRGAPPDDVEFWVPTYMFADASRRDAAFAAMPKLRVIQLVSAGAEVWVGHVPPGVLLCDGRGVHGGSTAEWALAAILSVLREFPRFVRAQEAHRWDPVTADELAGKRVLIIGAGDLGENVASRLRAFDAAPTLVARRARDGVRGVAELPQLLPSADIVVLVVPLTGETQGMVGAAFLASMADGALLVNAARGPVVVTDALVAELSSGRLRAALDVTDPEPPPTDHPLWTVPNLLLTPHVGGRVVGFPARAFRLVREQVLRYVAGEPLMNVVTNGY